MYDAVFKETTLFCVLANKWHSYAQGLKKTDPRDRVDSNDATLQAEAQRLSGLSEHLLADIGFEEDRDASDGARVWVRGQIRICLDE